MDRPGVSVLVIEDEKDVRDALETGLTQRGFRVRTAPDGLTGLDSVQGQHVDVILLDRTLPRLDGVALIPMLRRFSEAPIIMLSANGDVEARISALEAGADDYLAKPFHFGELMARVTSALRRPALTEIAVLRYADLIVDLHRRRVERSDGRIDLSAREFDLLAVLARSPERVYTRRQLIGLVWARVRDVSPSTVESYISYLRAKVDAPGRRRLIHTVRGVGYTLR